MSTTFCPAKVNLSLHVLGRRADGYHDLESLVVFADIGDDLSLDSGADLSLTVDGPFAEAIGAADDNLILRAARALAERIPGLALGAFRLVKRLPVAAGLGGGSADAAGALRLLAQANAIALDDARLLSAARTVGADVSVCLTPRPALMRGIGHDVVRLDLPPLAAVLVNPGVALETKAVFAGLGLSLGEALPGAPHPDVAGLRGADALMGRLAQARNDLALPARRLAPVIVDVERALVEAGARLARLSGSGASVVGLFSDGAAASAAAARVKSAHPRWWVAAAGLGAQAG